MGGVGALLVYYGLQQMRGANEDRDRRRGIWLLNIGLLLIALSVIALTLGQLDPMPRVMLHPPDPVDRRCGSSHCCSNHNS